MTGVRATRFLAATFVASALPLALLKLVPGLQGVLPARPYLVFHNTVEFFSIMVSLSVFGVGWYAYEQSRDRHALVLGAVFLATGLLDFMHTMGNAAMPAFVTANSTNKSTQFWVAARVLNAAGLLASAFVVPDGAPRWLSRRWALAAVVVPVVLVFVGVTFYPAYLPATYEPLAGLTSFKVGAEWAVIALLALTVAAYGRRLERGGDGLLVNYMAASVVGIFGEATFATYRSGFDGNNVLGHVYKVVAFYLIYKAAFAATVVKPYHQLSRANLRLRSEIGEREQAEAQVRALNAELEQRVSERTAGLEEAHRALREASRRKDEFLGMLSHELRNPLAPIRSAVYVLDRPEATGEQRARAGAVIGRQTAHLTRLVDDLLDVTRIARGKIELRRERVDLAALARRAAEDFRAFVEERRLALRVEVPAEPVWCDADPARVTQIVGNLLHNAAKFTPAAGEVAVIVRAAGPLAELHVRDTGEGIAPALLPHVFDAFVQGPSTLERASGGLGLGLAMVKGIAELHGGTATVNSPGAGQGTELVVALPIAAGAGVAPARAGPVA